LREIRACDSRRRPAEFGGVDAFPSVLPEEIANRLMSFCQIKPGVYFGKKFFLFLFFGFVWSQLSQNPFFNYDYDN
jgi:hypothetical protein